MSNQLKMKNSKFKNGDHAELQSPLVGILNF
jgi:hypothetical protein